MAKVTVVVESQDEYDLFGRAHGVLSEEMTPFFEDEERREEVGEDVVEAVIMIKNPDFIIRGNFAEQWEELGMEDWEWNHLFGSLIKHVSPTLVQQFLGVIEEMHGDLYNADEDNIQVWVDERINDNLTAHIPDEAVLEIDMREYVDNYEGSSDWVRDAVYNGLGSLVSIIKKNAIKEATMMLISNKAGN